MRRVQYAIVPILLAVATPAAAQSAPPSSGEGFHVGFGASISSVSGTVSPVFFVPIDVVSHLRVEPEIGYSRASNEQNTQLTPPVFPPGVIIPVPIITSTTAKQTTAATSAGTGIFFVQSREKIRFQYGARVGYTRTATNFSTVSTTRTGSVGTNTTTVRLTGYFVGPALGGEYFLTDRFSIGAELHLRYASVDGRQQITIVPLVPPLPNLIVIPPPQTTTSQTTIQTRASVVARVYVK